MPQPASTQHECLRHDPADHVGWDRARLIRGILSGGALFLAGSGSAAFLSVAPITATKFPGPGGPETLVTLVALLLSGLLAASVIQLRRCSRRETQLLRQRSALEAALALREQRLRDSEQRWQDVAEVSGDWIWETDADHRFTHLAVDAYIEATGLSPASTIGLTRWELAGAAAAQDEKWRQHRRDLDEHRPFRGFRYTALLPSGEVRHFAVSGKPVFARDGHFRGYRGIATNETAIVAALERAEKAETLLRDALDSLSEGFAIYDRDDCLVLCNEAYRRLYPACAPLMIPGVAYETLVRANLASGYFPDGVGREDEWVANALRIHGAATGEMQNQCHDGRWLLVSERRMRSGGLACLRIDITELKRIQIALRDSERRLRDFAELASDWFWEQDADLRFTWGSGVPALQSLAASGGFLGITRREFADPQDGLEAQCWASHQADLQARREFRDFRYRCVGRDGQVRYLSTSGKPLFDANGAFIGYRGTGNDVTDKVVAEIELRRAMEAAEAASRAKSEFLAMMSHELRTPLHSVIGFSELIRDAAFGPIGGNYLSCAKDIHESGRHLLGIINDVLDLATLDFGSYRVSEERVPIASVVDSCVRMLAGSALRRGVRIEQDEGLDGVILWVDRRALKQVCLNLIDNAVKFSPRDSIVSIRAKSSTNGGLELTVTDAGIGIDQAYLQDVFEPFYQVDGTHRRTHEGTGLGLAICRRLLALHDASIKLESAAGKGTRASVTFPGGRVLRCAVRPGRMQGSNDGSNEDSDAGGSDACDVPDLLSQRPAAANGAHSAGLD
ncbi:MAG TPA: ATP-binding protein [Acetobacteraceae bacterium]|nr:ATP-binding protein [Acetobacteraceae bacterium]